jgi:hypothetical protein
MVVSAGGRAGGNAAAAALGRPTQAQSGLDGEVEHHGELKGCQPPTVDVLALLMGAERSAELICVDRS